MGNWTSKDERQYEHIKESSRKRGKSTRRAKEIAGRTVNKKRREEGRTSNRKSGGKGNPNSSLEDRTKDELYNIAKDLGVDAPSRKKKAELIRAIKAKR